MLVHENHNEFLINYKLITLTISARIKMEFYLIFYFILFFGYYS
jgi:hypothetical protein